MFQDREQGRIITENVYGSQEIIADKICISLVNELFRFLQVLQCKFPFHGTFVLKGLQDLPMIFYAGALESVGCDVINRILGGDYDFSVHFSFHFMVGDSQPI